MQYTIETRELTNERTHRPKSEVEWRHLVVEADDADQAIRSYVRQREAELLSFHNPARGPESIGTMRKEDTLFLVRVAPAGIA